MNFKFHIVASFLLTSIAYRDPGSTLCGPLYPPAQHAMTGVLGSWDICPSLSPNLNSLPCLHVCQNRKLLPLPRSRLDFSTGFLLLLAGDVSLNPGPMHNIRVGTINARSMRDKAPALSDLIQTKSIHILAVTETWLTRKETTASLADITPTGFSFHHKPRVGRRGGGVGLLVSTALKFSPISLPSQSSFEAICGSISNGNICFNILNIYRPPGSNSAFLDQFQETLSHLSSLPHNLVILGDFNIHIDTPSSQTTNFLETLESFNLHQNVNFPTHILGHSLDLIITSSTCDLTSVVPSDRISDHFTVIAEFNIPVQIRKDRKTINYRNIKSIDLSALKEDIQKSKLIVEPCGNASDLANQYNNTLASILNKHAPLIAKNVSPKPQNPWTTPEIAAAKRHRRYLERIWRKNPTPLNRSRFTKQTHACNRLMSKAKSTYYSEIISENSQDQRSMWKAFNQILHRRPTMSLPECPSLSQLAGSFGSFFLNKITAIRATFPDIPVQNSNDLFDPTMPKLDSFLPASEDEIRRIILAAPNKSCDLDPLPTSLVKMCIDVLLTPITSLVNKSMAEGTFPDTFKNAHVTPLLKKTNLSKENMKNYRPVSNLSFTSKILEKVVANRLNSHICASNTSNPFQSAYKKFHSTETALLKIQNDVLMAMDKGRVTALTLLDLSAAFDTIDHAILLDRLENSFGISGSALGWLSSYLTDRCQQIKLDDIFSPGVPIPFGVPQGSVLGPLLFTMYTTPLSYVVKGHSVPHHLYADDSQLYLSFSSADSTSALGSLKSCLDSVQEWMPMNKLKLNPGKTEFILIGHERQRQKFVSLFPISLMGVDTSPSKAVRNLGVLFDQNFSFGKHISQVCGSCFYHIRDLRRIRRHLSLDNAKSLACALVTSRLDYCNSLLFGTADKHLTKLQRVQNCLARVVTRSSPFTRSVPLLRSLHWLPVRSRINFKISVLTFKSLLSEQPSYLHDMLVRATPSRSLRSNKGLLLSVPKVKSKTGSRAFSSCAPVLWNNLPLSLRSAPSLAIFRKRLKTHLFQSAFPP